MRTKQLAVIGGGAMGEAFIAGAVASGKVLSPSGVVVVEPIAGRRQQLEQQYGIETVPEPNDVVRSAYALLLAIKPQQFATAAPTLANWVGDNALVMTLMAGEHAATVQQALSRSAVIRLMPNILCKVGQGMIVWWAAPETTPQHLQFAKELFGSTGAELRVESEKYLDMATAVSGSGPAYVFLVIEALIDAGVHIGFSRDQATLLAQQTVLGAATLSKTDSRHIAELRNAVTSPGGTTVEGLLALERRGVRAAIVEAVLAAYAKAQSLG